MERDSLEKVLTVVACLFLICIGFYIYIVNMRAGYEQKLVKMERRMHNAEAALKEYQQREDEQRKLEEEKKKALQAGIEKQKKREEQRQAELKKQAELAKQSEEQAQEQARIKLEAARREKEPQIRQLKNKLSALKVNYTKEAGLSAQFLQKAQDWPSSPNAGAWRKNAKYHRESAKKACSDYFDFIANAKIHFAKDQILLEVLAEEEKTNEYKTMYGILTEKN